ncbi:MAG: winged helix DNA-binding protein [Gemmatimonadetes bacterium]|nr:winged helix DNA-binding protein [Gemmatimonadota bacterium]MBI3504487.1 winged helix DNA-binding protein [Pseudomonadota bacterium]
MPRLEPHADAVDAMNAIRRIVRALRMGATRSDGAGERVSEARLFVLRAIGETGAVTIGELARRTATAQSSVSEVVARLVERRLVTRETAASDRRRVEVSLTPNGRRLLASASETVPERLVQAFERLPEAERRALAAGLREWIREAGFEGIAPSMFFEQGTDDAAHPAGRGATTREVTPGA